MLVFSLIFSCWKLEVDFFFLQKNALWKSVGLEMDLCIWAPWGSLGKPVAEQVGGRGVFLFLSGAEGTKPSTMEINSDLNPQKQEIRNAGEEQDRAPGMGSVPTPLIWISCLCGFVMPPIIALKLFLHVILQQRCAVYFYFVDFFMWKKIILKLICDQPSYFWQHHKTELNTSLTNYLYDKKWFASCMLFSPNLFFFLSVILNV